MPYFQSVDVCQEIVRKDLVKIPKEYKDFDSQTRDGCTNPWKRMVVGIVTCKFHQKRFENYIEIFSKIYGDLGLDYYAILADPDIQTEGGNDYVVDHVTRTFTAKVNESYETLAHKLAIFYSYVYNSTDYDYVVKSDDGCLVDLSKVIQKLEYDYAGAVLKPTVNSVHFGKCSNKEYNKTKLDFGHNFKESFPDIEEERYQELYHIRLGGGGYGYRLSREALQYIDKYKAHILSLGLSYEDVLFGQILYLEGIKVSWHGIGRYHYIDGK
jgi:hypothetical protein